MQARRIPIDIPVAASSPPWTELPGDVTADISARLGAAGCCLSRSACVPRGGRLARIPPCGESSISPTLMKGNAPARHCHVRHAVDRSQGRLLDLTIQYFGDDALMNYIVDRSPNLKRLKLGSCFYISGYCATRMAAKLGHLEELHLTLRPGIGAADIEAIGYSCPMLKSFSCNGLKYRFPPLLTGVYLPVYYRNLYAFAISKSMPNLQHLQLFAHWIENEGLELILGGCRASNLLTSGNVLNSIFEGIWGKDAISE
ncbi:putative F-box/LRR-repeat protein 9 [Salvia hispanica]|uniref:putative F-box/LRR-repeat protein 9 n=1 Tax=Salvia hispanica TaxID=49212 RepID=UPI002009313D|nr:putative F-box/LRR-repeat protein 9 [Salvia hispanica]